VTKSYDATSHFESASDEVLEVYQRITGEQLDLNITAAEEEEY
jgi:Rab GDP dissociation inhibitor